jgi:hypothetical protein
MLGHCFSVLTGTISAGDARCKIVVSQWPPGKISTGGGSVYVHVATRDWFVGFLSPREERQLRVGLIDPMVISA